jgi:hypothetical protein
MAPLANWTNSLLNEMTAENLFRDTSFNVMALMKRRIHTEGAASDGSAIGTYKKSYIPTRQRFKQRELSKVILSLTRKLQNSWIVFGTDTGYAIGFQDEGISSFIGDSGSVTSLDKVMFAEAHFGKKILELTEQETRYATEQIQKRIEQIIAQANGGY